jgi:RNA polymerase sigma-70 factor (ECF subfamily)
MAYSQVDEELSKLACKEPEAFSELYRRHVVCVYRYHLARTGSVQDAEDLTAQTFLSALENLQNYQNRSAFVAWLFGIASHKLADFYRRQKECASLEAGPELADDCLHVEEIAEAHLRINDVTRALHSMVPERSEALVLRLFAGLSAREAGLVMGKSEAAVKMLVHRGLKDLQGRLIPGSTSHT